VFSLSLNPRDVFFVDGFLHRVLFAKHVQKKACKRKAHNRPKKTNPSRKNQKPTVYELYSIPEPPEYGVVEESEDAPQLYKDADEIRKIMMEKFEYSTLKEVTPKGPFDQPIPPEKLDTRTGLEPNFDVESIGSASP